MQDLKLFDWDKFQDRKNLVRLENKENGSDRLYVSVRKDQSEGTLFQGGINAVAVRELTKDEIEYFLGK